MSEGTAHQLAIEMARVAHDARATDVVVLDLRGISPVTDFTVIATGTSDRQIRAMADMVIERAKQHGERPFGKSGYDQATWVLVDFVTVVFHGFAKPYRTYYDLELLWGDAPRVDWARSESASA